MALQKIKSYVNNIRRKLRFAWGRAWHLRSKLIPRSVKQNAAEYLEEHQENLVFVLGSGRSGTQLISDLLDQAGMATVFHEPNFKEDVGTMDILRRDEDIAERYWREFRSIEVYRRWMAAPGAIIYGEVNGTIRYQAPAIKKLYPKAKMLLMVRDGRGVVRSVMGWPQFYNPGSKGAYALEPLPGDPCLAEWPSMSRFEKMCWEWRNTNEFLMRWIPESHWLRLERITTDYDYFVEQFASNIGIDITYQEWLERVSNKSSNASPKYQFPAWQDWSEDQRQAFICICGPTMEKLGYVI